MRRNSAGLLAAPVLDPAPRNPQPARRIQPTALGGVEPSAAPRPELGSASTLPTRASSAQFAPLPRPADILDERETLRLLRQAKGPARVGSAGPAQADALRQGFQAPQSPEFSRRVAAQPQPAPVRAQAAAQLPQQAPQGLVAEGSAAQPLPVAPQGRGSLGPEWPRLSPGSAPAAAQQRPASGGGNAAAADARASSSEAAAGPSDAGGTAPATPQAAPALTRLQGLRPGALLEVATTPAEGSGVSPGDDGAQSAPAAELSRNAEVASRLYSALLLAGAAPSLAAELLFLCRLLSLGPSGGGGGGGVRTPGSVTSVTDRDRGVPSLSSSFTPSSFPPVAALSIGSPEYAQRVAGAQQLALQQHAGRLQLSQRADQLELSCAETAAVFAAAVLSGCAALLPALPPVLLSNLQRCRALVAPSPEVPLACTISRPFLCTFCPLRGTLCLPNLSAV